MDTLTPTIPWKKFNNNIKEVITGWNRMRVVKLMRSFTEECRHLSGMRQPFHVICQPHQDFLAYSRRMWNENRLYVPSNNRLAVDFLLSQDEVTLKVKFLSHNQYNKKTKQYKCEMWKQPWMGCRCGYKLLSMYMFLQICILCAR
jgi:hypothetical protein